MQIFPKNALFVFSQTFYSNLIFFLQGYICHIRDISQLCLRCSLNILVFLIIFVFVYLFVNVFWLADKRPDGRFVIRTFRPETNRPKTNRLGWTKRPVCIKWTDISSWFTLWQTKSAAGFQNANLWQLLTICVNFWQLVVTFVNLCQLLTTFGNFW